MPRKLISASPRPFMLSFFASSTVIFPEFRSCSSQTILMNQGDIVILASDGLYKSLTAVQIQAIVEESGGNMSIAAERLCKEAQRLGECKQDNTTVIAVRYSLGSGNN